MENRRKCAECEAFKHIFIDFPYAFSGIAALNAYMSSDEVAANNMC